MGLHSAAAWDGPHRSRHTEERADKAETHGSSACRRAPVPCSAVGDSKRPGFASCPFHILMRSKSGLVSIRSSQSNMLDAICVRTTRKCIVNRSAIGHFFLPRHHLCLLQHAYVKDGRSAMLISYCQLRPFQPSLSTPLSQNLVCQSMPTRSPPSCFGIRVMPARMINAWSTPPSPRKIVTCGHDNTRQDALHQPGLIGLESGGLCCTRRCILADVMSWPSHHSSHGPHREPGRHLGPRSHCLRWKCIQLYYEL